PNPTLFPPPAAPEHPPMPPPPSPRRRAAGLEPPPPPATLVSPFKLTYQDADGDTVAVTLSRPVLIGLNVNNVFQFDSGAVTFPGDNTVKQQLRAINLTAVGADVAGVSVKVTPKRRLAHGRAGLAAGP